MSAFNPFERSRLKFEEPLLLISHNYDGVTGFHYIQYRASRSAANAGLLAKQFAIGKPLAIEGETVVVRNVALTATSGMVDEVTVRVEAVDFAAVLKGLIKPPIAEITLPNFGPAKRRILK